MAIGAIVRSWQRRH